MSGNVRAPRRVAPGVNIDIWSDVACPWCWIGKRRFERALAAFPHRDEVTVTWHSYQLDPSLPDHDDRSEAQYLAETKGMPVEQVRAMVGHVAEQGAGEGLTYDFDRLVVANSMRAHQLIQLAKEHEDAGIVERLEESLFAAHFEHGEDIGDADTLVRLATEAGLDTSEVLSELTYSTRVAAVEEDVRHAASLGLNSVPTFVLDMQWAVPGAQPTEVFTRALEQAWAASHPETPAFITVDGAQDAEACGPDGC